MINASLAVIAGLILLLWSADRFIEGAASVARHFGMSALVIGMVVVGFGTSAPEMLVSALASLQGNPGIALGNAYGSNIANIALILGITALVAPIAVKSGVLRKNCLSCSPSPALPRGNSRTAGSRESRASSCSVCSRSSWGGPAGTECAPPRTPWARNTSRN